MSSWRPFEGKIALITGSARGIGEAVARYCAERGAHVVINYVSEASVARAETLAAELMAQHGVRAVAIRGDVGGGGDDDNDGDDGGAGAAAVIEAARAYFADLAIPFQIDILVNNAGIARNARLEAVTHADVAETLRVNVLGPLRTMQAAMPHLPPAGARSGRIVNVSSVSARAGFVGQTVYAASKAALEAMTRVWARELAEHATVNAVTPGPVQGPMYAANSAEFLQDIHGLILRTPLMQQPPGVGVDNDPAHAGDGRPATTAEIAGIIGMLCLPEAGWCTGQVVCANGGMFM